MKNHRLALPTPSRSLSARLLVLTILFVMVGEVLIYVPSISRFRYVYLQERISAAYQASLAVEAAPGGRLAPELAAKLLEHARVASVALRRRNASYQILGEPDPIEERFELADDGPLILIRDAADTLVNGRRTILVSAPSPTDADVEVEVTLAENDLYAAMLDYSWRILVLSIIISLIAATLVFLALQWLFVRPLRRLIDDLAGFRAAPEDQSRTVVPGTRADEVGVGQRAVADMQTALRGALRQRSRLAAIGAAVSKISHDLKNILSTASLVSDRLAMSGDPEVKRQATVLIGTIDRAVVLCEDALRFARADEPELRLTRFDLRALVADVGEALGPRATDSFVLDNAVPEDSFVRADRDQIFRVLMNLGRNAVEAMKTGGRLTVAAAPHDGGLRVAVLDDGPGLPAKAREHLFEAFAGGARAGGTGLGLAIARELVRAHGGELVLDQTGPSGTRFSFTLPQPYARQD
ncbi:MAG: HAMP domain-containing sensor histidine kinase [Alphaproteobacteria bacterium]